MVYFFVKFLHVIGAAVLLGTGAGIAFFMLVAHLRGDPREIAGVARTGRTGRLPVYGERRGPAADHRHMARLGERVFPSRGVDCGVHGTLLGDRRLLAT